MKIKDGFVLRQIAGNYIIISTGNGELNFNGMITINETGAFLWELLSEGATLKELNEKMLKEYDVDEKTAAADIDEFVENLRKGKLLIEDE